MRLRVKQFLIWVFISMVNFEFRGKTVISTILRIKGMLVVGCRFFYELLRVSIFFLVFGKKMKWRLVGPYNMEVALGNFLCQS